MTNIANTQDTFVCSGRIRTVPVEPIQDNGIVIQYPIEEAAWIWHPALDRITEAFVCFKIEFELDADTETIIHVSADQRYELYIDGTLVSRGPDRSDLGHWSFASLPVRFKKGKHVITSEVYWIGDMAPEAQVTYRPGFIFAAENMNGMLDSGNGEWLVARREGISLSPGLEDTYHVVGPAFTVDGVDYAKPMQFMKPEIVGRQTSSPGGVFSTERILHPTSLPEQRHSWFSGGRIVAVNTKTESTVVFEKTDLNVDDQYDFLNKPVTVPSGSSVNILWDMDEYYCGYAHLQLEGGKGSTLQIEWAESLFMEEETSGQNKPKGNRNEIAGKYFWGFGDTYLLSGGQARYKSFWWRAGRYVLVRIKTADAPLTLDGVKLETTNYPLDFESKFHCPDEDFNRFAPLAERVLKMCGHETFMDCPYYEQLMYVGDGRLELLVWYMGSGDSRLPKRCIELFDWSRWKTGFIGER